MNDNQPMSDSRYPKETHRLLADCLVPSEGAALSVGGVVDLAKKRFLVNKDQGKRLYFILKRHIYNHADVETTVTPAGVPNDAWYVATWQQCLYLQSPTPQKGKYLFLIGRAVDGEIHHASSLAAGLTIDDLKIQRINCSLEQAKKRAYIALSRLRRKKIRVQATGTRGPGLATRNFSTAHGAWETRLWKIAAGFPVEVAKTAT